MQLKLIIYINILDIWGAAVRIPAEPWVTVGFSSQSIASLPPHIGHLGIHHFSQTISLNKKKLINLNRCFSGGRGGGNYIIYGYIVEFNKKKIIWPESADRVDQFGSVCIYIHFYSKLRNAMSDSLRNYILGQSKS